MPETAGEGGKTDRDAQLLFSSLRFLLLKALVSLRSLQQLSAT